MSTRTGTYVKKVVSQRALVITLISAVALVAAIQFARSWDLQSLWLDDQWAAIVSRDFSLANYLTYNPPIPLGFAMVQKVFLSIFFGHEYAGLVVPWLAAIMSVWCIGYCAYRLSKSALWGVVAAGLAAASPVLNLVSSRFKQYSLDVLIVTSLLLLLCSLQKSPRFKILVIFVAVGCIGAFFSFPSLLLFCSALLVIGLQSIRENGLSGAKKTLAIIVTAAAILCVPLWLGYRARNPLLADYWAKNYLDTTSLGAFFTSVRQVGWLTLTSLFPKELFWLVFFAPIGLLQLARTKKNAVLVYSLLIFFIIVFIAVTVHVYPLGTGRTDAFLLPPVAVLCTYGLFSILAYIPHPFVRAVPAGVLLAVLVSQITPGGYPARHDKELVQALTAEIKDSDQLVVYPHASFPLAYYSGYKTYFIHSTLFATMFDARIDRPHTTYLEATGEFRSNLKPLLQQVVTALAPHPDRVWYYSMQSAASRDEQFEQQIILQGYEIESKKSFTDAELVLFTKR